MIFFFFRRHKKENACVGATQLTQVLLHTSKETNCALQMTSGKEKKEVSCKLLERQRNNRRFAKVECVSECVCVRVRRTHTHTHSEKSRIVGIS